MSESIEDILQKLRTPLPEGAVGHHENNTDKKFIPNEWYEWWITKIAGSLFRLEERSTEIVPDRYVKVVMRVWIGDTFRDGIGFREVSQGVNLTNVVDLAKAEAERKAYDMFLMGWHNLGIYKRHGIPEPGTRFCVKCGTNGEQLSVSDIQFLESHPNIKHDFHRNCIPNHLLKEK